MAQVLGKHSSFIAKNFKKHALIYILAILFFILGAFASYVLAYQIYGGRNFIANIVLFSLYLAALFIIARTLGFLLRTDSFMLGGRGEKLIARELAKLPNDYLVLRNVQIGRRRADIDFIVFGPKGLITVEVKSHGGQITFNNFELYRNGWRISKRNILLQAKNEAQMLTDYLKRYGFSGQITPVIAFSNFYARMNFGYKPQAGVYVVQKSWLNNLILSLPEISYNIKKPVLEQALRRLVKN